MLLEALENVQNGKNKIEAHQKLSQDWQIDAKR